MFLLDKNKQFLLIIVSFLLIIFTFFFIFIKLINNSIEYKNDKVVFEKFEKFKYELSKNTNGIIRIKKEKISEIFNFSINLYFNKKDCFKYYINSEAKKKLNVYFKHSSVNPLNDKNLNIILCTENNHYLKYFEEILDKFNIIFFKLKIKNLLNIKNFNEIKFSKERQTIPYLNKKFLYNFEFNKYKLIQRKNSQINMYFKNKSFDNSFNLDENFNDKINYCYSEYVDNYYFCINLKQHKELINFKNYAEKFSFEEFINDKDYLNKFNFSFNNNELIKNEILLNISDFQNLKEFDKYRQKEIFHSSYNNLFFEISKNNFISITYMIYLIILITVLYLSLKIIYKLKT